MSNVETAVSNEVAEIIANAQGERRTVHFKKLKRSPKNVRSLESYSQASIEELGALIVAQGGILQNLIGYDEIKKGKPTGVVFVCAGGRRLAALNWLDEQQKINPDYQAPLLIVSEEVATEVSLAENSGREEMHPADEFMAFRRMIEDEKKTVEQVATTFGVTPLTVERRMKLACLAPFFIELYRKGHIRIDQLQALALAEEHERQLGVWESLPTYNRSAHCITQAITTGEVDMKTNSVARYVGAQAYEKAGGTLRNDLFNEKCYAVDYELLVRLATEKMAKTEAKLLKAGASFVDTRLVANKWELREEFTDVPSVQRELTKKEQKQLADFDEKLEQLETKLEQMGDCEEEEDMAAASKEYDEVAEAQRAFKQALLVPAAEYADKSGAVIYLTDGRLEKWENVIRKSDIRRQEAVARGENPDALVKQGRPAHSERLVRLLTSHRTAAIQASLMDNHTVALAAAVTGLMSSHFGYAPRSVSLRFTDANLAGNDPDNTLPESRAALQIEARKEKWEAIYKQYHDAEGGLLAWALQQPVETLVEVLAFFTGMAFSSVESMDNGENNVTDYMTALKVDMKEWWKPTAANYLNYVPKAKILATVTEAVSSTEAAAIANFKKGALVGAAETKIAETGWVPPLFRV